MIQDWKLDEVISKIKTEIRELEEALSPYRIVDVLCGFVRYNTGNMSNEFLNKYIRLRKIQTKLEEILL